MPSWKKVIVSGSSAHLNEITGSGGVHLPDSAKLTLGDAQDLKIYHGGSNSIIQEGGAGGLIIRATTLTLLADNTSDEFLVATENAGVDIYYDDVKKFETVAGGATVTGTLTVGAVTASYVGRDSDNKFDFDTDNVIKVSVNAVDDEFRFSPGGTFHADADVVAYSSTTASDMSLKKNITNTKYGLDDVMKLRGVDFDWKREDMGHDVGVLAQEVEAVIPEIVKEHEGLKGRGKFKAVDYNKLVPVLIESIKTLKSEIEILKKKVN